MRNLLFYITWLKVLNISLHRWAFYDGGGIYRVLLYRCGDLFHPKFVLRFDNRKDYEVIRKWYREMRLRKDE